MDCIINGIPVKVGQKWRNRAGDVVTITNLVNDAQPIIAGATCHGPSGGWLEFIGPGECPSDRRDLVDLVEDVAPFAPPCAAEDPLLGSWWAYDGLSAAPKIVRITSVSPISAQCTRFLPNGSIVDHGYILLRCGDDIPGLRRIGPPSWAPTADSRRDDADQSKSDLVLSPPEIGSWWKESSGSTHHLLRVDRIADERVYLDAFEIDGMDTGMATESHVSVFYNRFRPAEDHEIPTCHRKFKPIQPKRGLWRTRGGRAAAVFERDTDVFNGWPWIGEIIYNGDARGGASWTDQGRQAYDRAPCEFDLVAYIGPLPEDIDPAFAAIAKRTEEIVSTAEDRAEWLAAAEAKCARAAESRAQAEADRARRAALPVHDGSRLVPTEAPAVMVMLPGMGER